MSRLEGPHQLAEGTPARVRRVYTWAFAVAAFLGVLGYGLSNVPTVVNGLSGSCQALHLCAPPPLKPLPPLATGWLPSGSTFASASATKLAEYRSTNPDYDIQFHEGNYYHRSGPFNSNVEYRFEGTFTGSPKWTSLFEPIGKWLLRHLT
jgi:hypothetical protein